MLSLFTYLSIYFDIYFRHIAIMSVYLDFQAQMSLLLASAPVCHFRISLSFIFIISFAFYTFDLFLCLFRFIFTQALYLFLVSPSLPSLLFFSIFTNFLLCQHYFLLLYQHFRYIYINYHFPSSPHFWLLSSLCPFIGL